MSAFEQYRATQLKCLELLLRPIVGFCLKRSHSLRDLNEVAKKVFIDMAEEEIRRQNERVNISRLSVITGISREEVKRLYHDKPNYADQASSILVRVIGQWEQDSRFCTTRGKPRVISYEGDDNEFQDLVWSVSKHLNAGTVLFELERIGAVEKSTRGLRLLIDRHRAVTDPKEGYEYVAKDLATLIQVADLNLETENTEIRHHHLRTEYDNLYKRDLPKIKEWLYNEGKAFHKRAREYISQFDKDVVSATALEGSEELEAGGRAVLCGVSLVSEKAE